MAGIGVPELILIFVVCLIFFGPKKLPELGKSLGRGLAEFKRASNELKSTLEEEIRLDDRKQAQAMTAPPAQIPSPLAAPADTVARSEPSSS
jgi:sec-independent protein translocase protein TatA